MDSENPKNEVGSKSCLRGYIIRKNQKISRNFHIFRKIGPREGQNRDRKIGVIFKMAFLARNIYQRLF